jgi:hypothetical protein
MRLFALRAGSQDAQPNDVVASPSTEHEEDELWASLCSPEPYDRPAKVLKECGMCEGRGWIDEYDGPRFNSEAGKCARCGGRGKK